MKISFTQCRYMVAAASVGLFLVWAANAKADTLNAVFTGTIALDGDISDFFTGTTPKPGVCVSNDLPLTVGDANEPNNVNLQQDTSVKHPSGWNQRRIISAYRPDLHGGTIFVGLDLPGGTDSAANPNHVDAFFVRGAGIRPFDADGNGEAHSIGTNTVLNISQGRCTDPGTPDIVDCATSAGTGFSDVASDGRESYDVTIVFGPNPLDPTAPRVIVEYIQDAVSFASGFGMARLVVTSLNTPVPFGAAVSTATGGSTPGLPLGFDAEYMITNVNNAVTNPCVRLQQTVRGNSGSNVDAGNGEDQTVLVCHYELPAQITCEVLIFTNGVQVTENRCGEAADLGVAVGANMSVRVVVCADAGNAQGVTNININVPGVGSIVVPGPLAPGQCSTNTVGSLECSPFGVKNVSATVSARGVVTADCVPIQTSCEKSVQCCGEPCIDVVKKIACVDPLLDGGCGPFGDSATGVRSDTHIPAFCYSITVTNCGSLVLTNVTVVDDVLGDLSALFSDTFAVGQAETQIFTWSHAEDTQNTVTANGQSAAGNVQAQDSADAFVKRASIRCVKRVSSPSDTDGNPDDSHVTLPDDGADHSVTYRITVTAGAEADLANVTLSDPVAVALGCTLPGPFSLAAGASTNIECTVSINCTNVPAGGLTNTVTVTAEVDTSGGECGYDGERLKITVESTCQAVVECEAGQCVTRTPGYWFTHWKNSDPSCATLEKAIIANGNQLDLGFICLSGSTEQVLNNALGFFWKKRTTTSEGTRASQLCRARKQLAFHLIAAIANTTLLGTDPSACRDSTGAPFASTLIADAQKAAACNDLAKIREMTAKLDEFNNSGDDNDFPAGLFPCRADPRGAKRVAVDPTTQTNCNNTSHCAAGRACP